jgi:maltooligosyltrehalose trehalohydrolase
MSSLLRSQGADVSDGGVHYRTWAPGQRNVQAVIFDERGEIVRTVGLNEETGGYFSTVDSAGSAGDRYKYKFGDSPTWPDPASRWQPDGVHGASAVINPATYRWNDGGWSAPGLTDLIIYELHIGTFTEGGTFRAAIEKLDHVAALGANAIEIMPVADFPGERNWGYDGVMLYAPARCYGTPDDMRALVDAAHARGLAVILDVVYNHLGPDGNYLGVYSTQYFTAKHKTPWGDALNFELPPVRNLFVENASYWMREFHIDGFRFDATHEIFDESPTHVLAEIAEVVHAAGGFVIIEDDRNEAELLRSRQSGGLGIDGAWSDDFHHVVRVALTGNRESYFGNYTGTTAELVDTLANGWLYRGQPQKIGGKSRGTESAVLKPEQFIYCISNHDQVGNRAFGERLGHVVSPAAYRAASALICLVPYTPMLFMGQEWAASTPFRYFTDHKPELGRLVTKGRREEFSAFEAFADPATRARIPDPQGEETFTGSKLNWAERDGAEHAGTLELYREFLTLRKTLPALRDRARANWRVFECGDGVVGIVFSEQEPNACVILIDLIGNHEPLSLEQLGRRWRIVLSSNDQRFGGDGAADFSVPTVLVLAVS